MKRKPHLLRRHPHRKFVQVDGHPDYFVSRNGEVWSAKTGLFLKLTPIGGAGKPDHLRAIFRTDGKHKHYLVHRLVAMAFIGNPPSPLHEINHKNGKRQDNRVENLEWCTRSENILHAFRTGLNTPRHGSLQGASKLKEADIPVIKARLKNGETKAAIAIDYKVTPGTIAHIDKGRSWNHVKEAA